METKRKPVIAQNKTLQPRKKPKPTLVIKPKPKQTPPLESKPRKKPKLLIAKTKQERQIEMMWNLQHNLSKNKTKPNQHNPKPTTTQPTKITPLSHKETQPATTEIELQPTYPSRETAMAAIGHPRTTSTTKTQK